MPYKDPQLQAAYQKGYYAGYRRATIDHKGGVCEDCGTSKKLEIDHNPPLNRKGRSLEDLQDLSKVRIKCEECHKDRKRRH